MKCKICKKTIIPIRKLKREHKYCSRRCMMIFANRKHYYKINRKRNLCRAVKSLLSDSKFMRHLSVYINGIGGWQDEKKYLIKALRYAAETDDD